MAITRKSKPADAVTTSTEITEETQVYAVTEKKEETSIEKPKETMEETPVATSAETSEESNTPETEITVETTVATTIETSEESKLPEEHKSYEIKSETVIPTMVATDDNKNTSSPTGLPVPVDEAIVEVKNKLDTLRKTREMNADNSSIVSAVDKEIEELEIILNELNKKIIKTQQNAAKKEVEPTMSNIDNNAITHKSILNAQIVKTLLNSKSSEPLSVTEETCQLMYDGRELSRTYNNFISACSRLLPNFSMESYKGNHVLINNETFSIYRIQKETLNIINSGRVNVYNDNNERILNDIEIEFIRATSEGAIEIYKEVDVHGNISEYALRRATK